MRDRLGCYPCISQAIYGPERISRKSCCQVNKLAELRAEVPAWCLISAFTALLFAFIHTYNDVEWFVSDMFIYGLHICGWNILLTHQHTSKNVLHIFYNTVIPEHNKVLELSLVAQQ